MHRWQLWARVGSCTNTASSHKAVCTSSK